MGNILLAGTGGDRLLSELTEEALAAGNRVAVTSGPPDTKSVARNRGEKQNLYYVAWNPRSPLSARTVVTETLNVFETIDEVIIVFSADTGKKEFHELSFADMEKTVDDSIKSFFFLVKEVFMALQRQKKGVLVFAHHDGGAEALPPPQAAASTAFRAFASALFTQYQNEPFTLYGYYSSAPETKGFARFLAAGGRTEKTARRWTRFSDKPGFFSFARNK